MQIALVSIICTMQSQQTSLSHDPIALLDQYGDNSNLDDLNRSRKSPAIPSIVSGTKEMFQENPYLEMIFPNYQPGI